jgi:predicted dehydrogenase
LNKLSIGVLGCADIADRMVIPAICSMAQFQLHGVASREKAKAQLFSEKFNTHAFESYESLLESNVQSVYIPLPNGLHYEWIKKSLEHRKHVLVEKSMACSLKEVMHLNEIARDKGLALIENFQFRFHPQIALIQSKVGEGVIGELRNVRASFGFPPFNDPENIRYKKELGGGALFDAGAYTIKVAQIFLGEDIYVGSAALERPSNREVDIWGGASLKQKHGNLEAQVAFGFDNFYQNSLELWGTKGKITAPRIFTSPPDCEASILIQTSQGVSEIKTPPANHFQNMLSHFYDLVSSGNGLQSEYEQNINQSRLIEELYEKAIDR